MRLPNLATVGAHHRVAGFAAEGLRELRHVGDCAIDAEAPQGVRVGVGLQALEFGARGARPDLCEAEEETLLRREAVNGREAFVLD